MELDNNTEAVTEEAVDTTEVVNTDSHEVEPIENEEESLEDSAEDDSDLLVEAQEPTADEQAAHDASFDEASEDDSDVESLEDEEELDWELFDLALTATLQDKALTTEERNDLPDSAFCGPNRSFPVNDCAHVTAARRLIGRAKLSDAQKAKVLACVNRKADKMSCDVEKDEALTELQKDYTIALARIQSLEDKLENAIELIAKYKNKEFSFESDANRLEVLVTYFDSICIGEGEEAKSVVVVDNPSVDSSDVVTVSKAMTKLGGFEKTVVDNYTLYHECSIKSQAWIEWYKAHKKIFEDVK